MYALILGIAFAVFSGCSNPANDFSDKRRDEQVKVVITHQVEPERREIAPIIAVLAPLAMDFAIRRVGVALKDESERYVAEYQGEKADDSFFSDKTVSAKVNFTGLEITRTVTLRPNAVNPTATAFYLKLAANTSRDGTAFQLKPTAYKLCYSKAKVAGKFWYLPWTWFYQKDENIDIDVHVTIEALWVDGQKDAHNIRIAELRVPLRGISLQGENCSNKNGSQLSDDSYSGWFSAVPRTVMPNRELGLGTYVVKVSVREYDDFGERVKQLAEYVDSNRDIWLTKFKNSIKK